MNLAFYDSVAHWDWCSKNSCVLQATPLLLLGAHSSKTNPSFQLGFSDSCLNLKIRREWECLALRAVAPMGDEIPSSASSFYLISQEPLSATTLSSSDGTNVRVAYQGIPGAYSEAAALQAFPECETVPCDDFEAVFKAVELWLVDRAVLPIENSVSGSIHRNYDLLLRHRLHIVGEVQLIVNHCLLGLPEVRKEELKHILSHPQALQQCGIILNKLGVTKISTVDTAVAAQMVESQNVREIGAIASVRAAAIYGLNVIAKGIQTSIVFTLEEGPGVVFKALAVFTMRDIELLKIESRPLKRQPPRVVDESNDAGAVYFEYLFYIDFEASMAEPRAQFALAHLQEFARFIRLLGCYPKDVIL